MEPEKQKLPATGSPPLETARFRAYTDPPRIDSLDKRKLKFWIIPSVIILGVAGAAGSLEFYSHEALIPPPLVAQQTAPNDLTLSGADGNEVATAQAIREIKAGTQSPLLAPFTEEVKQEILNGERQFYCIPVLNTPADAFRPGDRVRVDFNGGLYGIYDLGKDPYTLLIPLKRGDHFTLTCLSVAPGKAFLTLEIATDLSPVVSRPLGPGQSQSWSVTHGDEGTNYAWYEEEAGKGNATAQYGLGHMYQYGIGVPQDLSQAVKWYRQAASQGYADARTQLSRLGY